MRVLAVLLLVGSLALSCINAEQVVFSPDTHSNYYDDLKVEEVPLSKRVKRSVLAAIGITSQCEPGWTGQYCEHPICGTTAPGQLIPNSYMNRLIDQLYLPSGCTGKYYVPVDGVSGGLNIQVNAAGTPWINLTDVNGNIMTGSGGAGNNHGYMTYPASLPPGSYQLTIDNGGIPTTDCIVTIEIWSWLAIQNGFTYTPQSDDTPADEYGFANTPMYFISHVFNITTPGTVGGVTIRNPKSQSPVYRSLLTSRYGCSYEWYAGQFSCELGQSYVAHVDGTDQTGNAWRRSILFGCLQPLTTTTLAPTTPPFTCYNGGTLLYANTPDATCFCPELFTGNQCQQPACMNGGTLAPSGLKCECPDGYWGDNCEHVTCDPNFGPYLTDEKSLVVVIRNVASMNKYADTIVAAIQAEMEDNDGLKDGLYSSFVLVRYGDGDYLTKQYPSAGYQAFLADLRRVAIVDTIGNCSDVVFDSLYSIFVDYVYDKSPILHFTDAVASDVGNWRTVTEANSRRNLPIFTFFLSQSSCNFDPLNEGFRAIQNAGLFSGGLTFQLSSPSNDTLKQFILGVMRSTTKNQNLVYANDLDRCPTNVQRSFMIDSSAENVIIIATGNNLVLTISDPDNDSRNFLPFSIPDTQNNIWEVTAPKTGEYMFQINTANPQDPCSIRIYSRSNYDFFFATSLAPWNDAIDTVPVVGTPLALVGQLNGLYNATRDPYRLFAEITVTTNRNRDNNSPGKPMYYSNGVYRDECGYHLYFGVADFCEFDSQPFYATVFADDNNGYTIQRTAIGFCSIFNTTTQPVGTCLNGGVIDPVTNNSCICQVGYTGDFCQSVVCQNGGTPAGSFCMCNPGSWGTFCELYTCLEPNPFPDQTYDGQTMVFVVAARPSMQATWNALAANIAEFVRDVQTHSPNWIKAWVLVTAAGNDYDALVNDPHPQAFVDGIRAVAANLSAYSTPGDDGCQVQLLSALRYGTYLSERRSSIYLFTDAGAPDDPLDYSDVFTMSTENQITINIIQTATRICTTDGVVPDYIQELAFMTSGFFYMTPSVAQILPYITTMYKSGISAQIASPDCTPGSAVPAYQYIPVDGWTQSMTIAVIGENITGVDVYLPDGTPALNAQYEIQMIQEPNLWLIQYIAACQQGGGWKTYKQFCLSFGFNTLGWYDASSFCHSLNPPGALADVTTQEKDDLIHTQTQGAENWIGLIRNGNSWTWDVPDGTTAQPLDPSFTKWCTDGTWPAQDPSKNCVYMDPTGCWKNDDCTVKRFFVCQNHRYGMGLYPGDPNNNIIPGGRWSVAVTSGSGSCYAQVRSQSEIQVFFGFVNDPHNDFPQLFPNLDSNTNYVVALPTYISQWQADGSYGSMEGNLNYAIIGENYTLTNPLTMSNRWECGYSYVSLPFSCPSQIPGQNFFIQFSGIDQYGYAFNRFGDSNCYRQVTRCSNGGFVNNGVCVCPPGWTGSRCQNPLCQNGGIDDGGPVCRCPPMFGGSFCEQPYCEPPYPAAFGDNSRTLAIMLETSYGMGSTIWLMQKNLKAALDSIRNDPTTSNWFNEYILYPFDSTSNKQSWYPPVVSTNSDDIVAAVKNIAVSACPGNGTCDTFCPRPYLDVLDNVLSMPQFVSPNSIVLIITRSTPEDASQQDRLTQILQETRAQVNFILPAIDSPCGEGWDTPGVRSMYRTVQYSDGNLFVMSPGDVCANFLTKYVPSLYRSAGLESAQLSTCGNSDVLFQVEHEMYEFTIDYYMPLTNPPFTVTLTDPAGDVIPLPPSIITSDSNYLGVVKVNDTGVTRAGTYLLSIRGNVGGALNYCFLNIRGRSSIEIYPGFVQTLDGYNGAITDSAHYAPLLVQNNTIVVHGDGLDAAGGVLLYAQFIAPNSVGLVHTTYLKRRDSQCGYEWYGNLPIDWQEQTLLVVIYGRDGRGANFHRNYLVTGVASRTNPQPPPARCNLQEVQQDIVFMIDSSLKADDKIFKTLKSFAANALVSYKFSPSFTQAGSLTISDKAYGGFSFLAATSWSLWNQYVNNLTYSAQPGQNTASGFQYIVDNFHTENQGYRTNPGVRHSIIYLTNTDPTDADPGQIPYTLRRSGAFGVAVLVYNTTTTDNMRAIASASNCIYQANTLDDLNHYGTNFVQQMSCYRQSPCGM